MFVRYLLESEVVFIPEKKVLMRDAKEVYLYDGEARLLHALLQGKHNKEELIEAVWGAKGIAVSDSSYYKAVNQLRNNFLSWLEFRVD